jgi:hypothetical protein
MNMANTVSFFDAVQDGFVVANDSFLDMMIVWNGSITFNVFYNWGGSEWQEIDCFTIDGEFKNLRHEQYSIGDAHKAAKDYFARIIEEAAQESEWMDNQVEAA